MQEYHITVLLEESLAGLGIVSHGTYVDVTFGAGGHSKSILNKLDAKGHLYGFDQDEDAVANIEASDQFTFIASNFKYLDRFMRYYDKLGKVDGVLADLGVSSHQFDIPERGFSYRFDAKLDMRMDVTQEFSALDLLATYNEQQWVGILSEYGEVRNSKTLARALVRNRHKIKTTFELNELLSEMRIGPEYKYFAKVYQAIRIEVNDEIGVLQEMLSAALEVLRPGCWLSVISYHSLEDRQVKNFMKSGNFEGELVQDDFGRVELAFKVKTKKPILPSKEEMVRNTRSKSAKLRVAQKL